MVKTRGRRSRVGVVLGYALVGIAWTTVSGVLLLRLPPQERAWASGADAMTFVVVTASLLWLALSMRDRGIARQRARLVSSEERYRMLAERAQDVVYRMRITPVPSFEYVSPSIVHLTGHTPEEHYADPALGRELIPRDDLEALARASSTGPSEGPALIRWRRADGQQIWTEHTMTAIRDNAGRLIAVEGVARDVTRRVEAESRGAMLLQAMEAAPLGVGVLGGPANGFAIDYVNPALAALAGRDPAALVGHSAVTVDVLGAGAVTSQVAARLAEGEPLTVTSTVDAASGPLPVEALLAPILGADGAVDRILAFVQDRSEAAGRAVAESRLRAAFDASPLGMVIADRRGVVTAWNPTAERLLGRPADAAIGWTPPSFLDRIPAVAAGTWDGVSGLPARPVLQHIPRPDGTTVPCEVSIGVIRDEHGEPSGVMALFTDMTETLAKDEWSALLRRAIDHAAEGILITDAAGVITYVNPALEATSGYRADELIGQNPRILQSGQTPEATYREMWRALATGSTWRGVLVNRRKDGSTYEEEATFSAVPGPDGRPIAYVGVKRDLTMELRLAQGLSSELRDRAAVEEAMSRIEVCETAALTARRICEVVAGFSEVDAVWIAELPEHSQDVVPIASVGASRAVEVGRPADPTTAAYVRHRSATGPWSDNFVDGVQDPRLAKPALAHHALVAAPIRHQGRMVALLCAVAQPASGEAWIARHLRTVSAIATHAAPLLGPQMASLPHDPSAAVPGGGSPGQAALGI